MRRFRVLPELAMAIALILAIGVYLAPASRAETVNQDPFEIVVQTSQSSNVWESPHYTSSTGAGYSCTTVQAMSGHISYWIVNLWVSDPVTKATSDVWGSPHETSDKTICSSYSQASKNSSFWVRVRACSAQPGVDAGFITGLNDIYTDFICGTLCGGMRRRQ